MYLISIKINLWFLFVKDPCTILEEKNYLPNLKALWPNICYPVLVPISIITHPYPPSPPPVNKNIASSSLKLKIISCVLSPPPNSPYKMYISLFLVSSCAVQEAGRDLEDWEASPTRDAADKSLTRRRCGMCSQLESTGCRGQQANERNDVFIVHFEANFAGLQDYDVQNGNAMVERFIASGLCSASRSLQNVGSNSGPDRGICVT